MRTNPSEKEAGFTLIEALVVTTVVGVLASVTVPNLLSSRLAANEAAVVANLRAIATAQFQFKSAGELDRNNDSGFEFGTFGELGAIDDLRGSGVPITRNLLSRTIAEVDANGWASHHGYYFCLYLPDNTGTGVAGTPANSGSIDDGRAHQYWTCLAWPIEAGTTGNLTYFVNQQGQVLKTVDSGYTGTTSVPPAGAGLLGVAANGIETQSLASGAVGADGNSWVIVH